MMRLIKNWMAGISLAGLLLAFGITGCQKQPNEVQIREPKDVPPPSDRGGGAFKGKPVEIPK